jgi:hypothetical protein
MLPLGSFISISNMQRTVAVEKAPVHNHDAHSVGYDSRT